MARILAASFIDKDSARLALDALDGRFPPDAIAGSVAELGSAGDPGGPTTILAVRVPDEVMESVRRAVERSGGTVVVDVDEAATHRP